MELKPIGERVLLKPVSVERTKGGLYLPESAKEAKKEGEVLAVGTSKDGKELPLVKGDKVLYGGYSSEEFEFEGQKVVIVEYKDILAKVE